MSFPTVLGVITGLRAASAPVAYVIGLGVLGAVAILAWDILQAEIPESSGDRWKWWFARLTVWLFNTAVIIGSVVFLGEGGNAT